MLGIDVEDIIDLIGTWSLFKRAEIKTGDRAGKKGRPQFCFNDALFP